MLRESSVLCSCLGSGLLCVRNILHRPLLDPKLSFSQIVTAVRNVFPGECLHADVQSYSSSMRHI